ncbi:unnamed protein product [Paramecium pentaurelia]|uniref:Uncharacterized protein n=1 Tax=Paramecium pentaurelia TaxID=43138 RepID=A0A8S1YMC5_9CILI|nr:unnamed protein product [Paramecium pentaurelia]
MEILNWLKELDIGYQTFKIVILQMIIKALQIFQIKTTLLFLILQGSMANETLHMLLIFPNIYSILIYCQFPEKYEDLIQKFKQIVFITNQQDEVIVTLKKRVAPFLILREINLYKFSNYFQQIVALYYLSEQFSQSSIPFYQKMKLLKQFKIQCNVCQILYTYDLKRLKQNQLFKFMRNQKMDKLRLQFISIQDLVDFVNFSTQFYKFQSKREFQMLQSQQNHQNTVQKILRHIDPNLFASSDFFLYRGVDCTIEQFRLKHKSYDLAEILQLVNSMLRIWALYLESRLMKIIQMTLIFKWSDPSLFIRFQNEQDYLFSCFLSFIITKFNQDNIIDIEFVKI